MSTKRLPSWSYLQCVFPRTSERTSTWMPYTFYLWRFESYIWFIHCDIIVDNIMDATAFSPVTCTLPNRLTCSCRLAWTVLRWYFINKQPLDKWALFLWCVSFAVPILDMLKSTWTPHVDVGCVGSIWRVITRRLVACSHLHSTRNFSGMMGMVSAHLFGDR